MNVRIFYFDSILSGKLKFFLESLKDTHAYYL